MPGGVLAELDCFSAYSFIRSNPPGALALLRAIYGKANPIPLLGTENADNQHFVDLAASPEGKDIVWVHGMLKPMKRLNDKIFNDEATAGKEDVNLYRNLFRIFLMDNLNAHPELPKALVAKFTDFKTVELGFDLSRLKEPKNFEAELDHVVRITQLQFSKVMEIEMTRNPALLKKVMEERGLTSDFRTWHLFGMSKGNPDFAVFAARQSAGLFDREHGIALKAHVFTEDSVLKPLRDIEETIKPRLLRGLGADSPLFDRYEGGDHLVLSRDAIDILRKVSAATFEEYAAIVRKDFEARFNRTLGDPQILDLRDYFALADDFQPTVRLVERTQIDLKNATDGLLNVDFAAQNVENMHHTMGALAQAGAHLRANKPGAGTLAIERAREGEKLATIRLMELQETFDAARQEAGISGEYQHSGDDGSVLVRGSPTPEQREKFYRALLRGRTDKPYRRGVPPASDYRVVFLPPLKGKDGVDTVALNLESVKGENFEKALRGSLYGKVALTDLKQVGISVDMDPATKTYRLVFFGPKAAVEAVQKEAQTVMSAKGLAPDGYRLTATQAIW